ncbi:MAG TPA: hypothetical protein VG411_12180, partial [Actinomycetota bacterium]|nr:hypothetical protein [Actinomycetota bacterium]
SIFGLAGAADQADARRVEIPASAPGAPRTRAELHGVRDAANSIPGGRTTHVGTGGVREAQLSLWAARDAANSIPRNVTVRVAYTSYGNVPGAGAALRGMARGGPIRAGEAVIVGEERPELFVPDRDGTILPEVPRLSRGVPTGHLFDSSVGAGGGVTYKTVIQVGSVVANDPEALVNGLKRYVRENGPLPVPVRG